MATIAAVSSKGQIVLPVSIRKRLGLKAGSQLVVISDDDNILLKPVKEPSIEEFRELLAESQDWAKNEGITEEDIAIAIKAVRNSKKK